MRDLFYDFLFSKGYFVGEGEEEKAPVVLASLAKLFNIRIVSNPGWANLDMVRVASRNLGKHVPTPFYQGFPKSVRGLSIDRIIVDRLLHYQRTYGLGDFSQPGHSLFEREVMRECFNEDVAVSDYSIVSEAEALELFTQAAQALLASSRPLNDTQYQVVRTYVEDFCYDARCNCKDTIVRLLIDLRDPYFARLLKLSDVMRLVEQLQFQSYESTDVNKLNLRNRDRKLLAGVLDRILEDGECDMRTCLEQRKRWQGLLHHLHYRPTSEQGKRFVDLIRNGGERSVYAEFERLMAQDEPRQALDLLREEKGTGAVLRRLDYLLGKCKFPATVDYVLDAIQTDNKILLIQLLMHYSRLNPQARRVFTFQKFGMLRTHVEEPGENPGRTTVIPERIASRVRLRLRQELARCSKGTLGKVYIDRDMKRLGLPLQEGTSMSGVGTLPRGSRLRIPEGKKIRAFTYWERVDDIDLSAFVLYEDGRSREFSWRTVSDNDSILYSGDQTSGYEGGSEYFDIDLDLFAQEFTEAARYVVLCANVYSGTPFSECLCTAGYMMRDRDDSGEVFEPKTVKSSFGVTCPSTFAYLFGIDMKEREFVWLNMARDSRERVAGETHLAFLLDYLNIAEVYNLGDFAWDLATEVVEQAAEADVVFSDKYEPLREGAELIRSRNMERMIELLNTKA